MLKWFRNNQMMANPWKFQNMLLGKHTPLKIEIEGFQLELAKSVKLVRKLKASKELEMPWTKNKRNYCITLLFHQFNYCYII